MMQIHSLQCFQSDAVVKISNRSSSSSSDGEIIRSSAAHSGSLLGNCIKRSIQILKVPHVSRGPARNVGLQERDHIQPYLNVALQHPGPPDKYNRMTKMFCIWLLKPVCSVKDTNKLQTTEKHSFKIFKLSTLEVTLAFGPFNHSFITVGPKRLLSIYIFDLYDWSTLMLVVVFYHFSTNEKYKIKHNRDNTICFFITILKLATFGENRFLPRQWQSNFKIRSFLMNL